MINIPTKHQRGTPPLILIEQQENLVGPVVDISNTIKNNSLTLVYKDHSGYIYGISVTKV